jgi:hypothetical protein
MRSSNPGIAGLVFAFVAASALITVVTRSYVHWPFVLLGLVVGLMAVQIINP